MVWGYTGLNGVGKPMEVKGRMDVDQCVDILDNYLILGLEKSGIPEENCVFQQDSNPKCTAKKARKWMETIVSLC